MKKILYLDMDGVVADFDHRLKEFYPLVSQEKDYETRKTMVDDICYLDDYFFQKLPLIEGAKEAVMELNPLYEVYFMSTPMWHVPTSFMQKRIWLEDNFGEVARKKLILTHRKDLAIGDYLVDDRTKNGAGEFKGEHIHYGTEKFPNWEITLKYLKTR